MIRYWHSDSASGHLSLHTIWLLCHLYSLNPCFTRIRQTFLPERVRNLSNNYLHMGDINGRQKAVDDFLALPDVFLQILEDKKDDSRRESAERPDSGQ